MKTAPADRDIARAKIIRSTPAHITREHAEEARAITMQLRDIGRQLGALDRKVELPQSAAAMASLRAAWAHLDHLAETLDIAAEVPR